MAERIASKVAAGMRRPVRPGMVKLRDFVLGRPSARKQMAEVKTVAELTAKGYDRLHATYIRAQNYLSVFGELASRLPEFRDYLSVVSAAEQEYVPGWPPMSPVSMSHFYCWAMLDVAFGEHAETLCSCAVEIGRSYGMSEDFAVTVEVMGESMIGLYEVLRVEDDVTWLWDVLDGQRYPCKVPAQHSGRPGELWLARLFPPLNPSFDYGLVFTSPYVMHRTTVKEWMDFFSRQERKLGLDRNNPECYRRAIFKPGPAINYWNEYIFLAYRNATREVIYLQGIPDMPASLPQAREFVAERDTVVSD